MIFTLEARFRYPSEFWRLQLDGSWHLVEDLGKINAGDWTTKSISEVDDSIRLVRDKGTIKLGTKTYPTKPSGVISPRDNYVFFEPTVRRTKKPHKFTIDEMKKVISEGNDNQSNVLILDLNGYFELVKHYPDIVNSIRIAVRSETFDAGNGYVGSKAAADKMFISSTFRAMLSGWVDHLKSQKPNYYVDMGTSKSEEELWKEVDGLTSNLS